VTRPVPAARPVSAFLAAIDSGGRPVADIEQGYISASCCILGNLSMTVGRTLAWEIPRSRGLPRTKKLTACSGGRIVNPGYTPSPTRFEAFLKMEPRFDTDAVSSEAKRVS
jgi:hypothetical protein